MASPCFESSSSRARACSSSRWRRPASAIRCRAGGACILTRRASKPRDLGTNQLSNRASAGRGDASASARPMASASAAPKAAAPFSARDWSAAKARAPPRARTGSAASRTSLNGDSTRRCRARAVSGPNGAAAICRSASFCRPASSAPAASECRVERRRRVDLGEQLEQAGGGLALGAVQPCRQCLRRAAEAAHHHGMQPAGPRAGTLLAQQVEQMTERFGGRRLEQLQQRGRQLRVRRGGVQDGLESTSVEIGNQERFQRLRCGREPSQYHPAEVGHEIRAFLDQQVLPHLEGESRARPSSRLHPGRAGASATTRSAVRGTVSSDSSARRRWSSSSGTGR